MQSKDNSSAYPPHLTSSRTNQFLQGFTTNTVTDLSVQQLANERIQSIMQQVERSLNGTDGTDPSLQYARIQPRKDYGAPEFDIKNSFDSMLSMLHSNVSDIHTIAQLKEILDRYSHDSTLLEQLAVDVLQSKLKTSVDRCCFSVLFYLLSSQSDSSRASEPKTPAKQLIIVADNFQLGLMNSPLIGLQNCVFSPNLAHRPINIRAALIAVISERSPHDTVPALTTEISKVIQNLMKQLLPDGNTEKLAHATKRKRDGFSYIPDIVSYDIKRIIGSYIMERPGLREEGFAAPRYGLEEWMALVGKVLTDTLQNGPSRRAGSKLAYYDDLSYKKFLLLDTTVSYEEIMRNNPYKPEGGANMERNV